MATSAADVARGMLEWLENSRSKELDQQDAVVGVRKEFGEDFLYQNANGNLAIDPKKYWQNFVSLLGNTVVWEKGGYWRKRKPGDPKGRRKDRLNSVPTRAPRTLSPEARQ